MNKVQTAYFGSPDFSASFLEKVLTDADLKKVIEIKLVITQSDKPVGRKQILTETPVKKVAKKYRIPVLELKSQNSKVKTKTQNLKTEKNNKEDKKFLDLSCSFEICDLSFELDLCLVYAFSQIIPKDLLRAPKLGFWNIHPSLLPKYRGPSPIAYPLIFGEKETGVTIIKMDEKIDHGPIIAQEKLKIEGTDRRPDLERKLTDLGFKLFKKTVLNKDSLYIEQYKEQNHKAATYSRLLKKQDGFIPLPILKKAIKNEPLKFEELPMIVKEYLIKNPKSQILNPKQNVIPAKAGIQKNYIDSRFCGNGNQFRISSKIIYDYFRGLYPWPGIWTLLRQGSAGQAQEKRLKIIEMNLNVTRYTLHVTRVQIEGKKPVNFETFNRAYGVF